MTDTYTIPGHKAGTWTIDPSHSEVAFSVRHLLISKVKGKFEKFDATFVTGESPLDTKLTASAEVESINTGDANRDGHLRTNDFFNAPEFPTITFVSNSVVAEKDDLKVTGDLTIKGVTKPVTFDVEFGGFGNDLYGNYKLGLTAKTVINRNDFGVNWNAPLEAGGVLVGDDVTITIDLQASLQA
ncbi:polyisoprenoid-binding protein [Subtercola boreus]|uniref:Polyisoprenoid-binding protein n=1 Tax=Subtercola boreus TaxID=120213 RepID=A0A3E0VGX4_9MICO|nr:YceI family protein [Subtercola boreus]RFA08885.1 polyisoprenoid-binding protein [Subtercola boreus]TQL54137.1 polyisoprenoid-binding protein YceI [Subtercola boreus]